MASSGKMLSSAEFKEKQKLDEARKAGTAEPERDEDGNEINPHIPQFIASAPWYLSSDKPGLKHQRLRAAGDSALGLNADWYRRGQKKGPAAKSFRKGACANCGAMTHKTADCVERPRKKGAKFTGKDIKADELVQDIDLDYAAKRDRWNGYDPSMHKAVMDRYEVLENQRDEQKAKEVAENLAAGDGNGEGADDEEKDSTQKMLGQHFDQKTRMSVRNLRIREDTPKFLYNLDPNSAHYDSRTRSMRENPLPDQDPSQAEFAGDNFVRYSGDTQNFAKLQLYELAAQDRGADVNLAANPTLAQLAQREFVERKQQVEGSKKSSLTDKYGAQQSAEDQLPAQLRFGQTEAYTEYSADGSIVKGLESVTPKSKYDEDVYQFNHTAVWGSFWEDGQWGYACCHQTVRNAYCTGSKGAEVAKRMKEEMASRVANARSELEKRNHERLKEAAAESVQKAKHGATEEELNNLDPSKVAKARLEERKRNQSATLDDRKRKFNSLKGEDDTVTEEMMEAFRMERNHADDPMAAFMSKKAKR